MFNSLGFYWPSAELSLGFFFLHREKSKWKTGGRKEERSVFRKISLRIMEKKLSIERGKQKAFQDTGQAHNISSSQGEVSPRILILCLGNPASPHLPPHLLAFDVKIILQWIAWNISLTRPVNFQLLINYLVKAITFFTSEYFNDIKQIRFFFLKKAYNDHWGI